MIFRVDSSTRMGTGHLMRCLTLAEALREQRNVQPRAVCREHVGHMTQILESQGVAVSVLPAPVADESASDSEDYSKWLGVTERDDALQTITAFHGDRVDWLIVDHYGLSAEWESILREHSGSLMVIDDLANRPHDCDVLLDQTLSSGGTTRYQSLVPATCNLLIGPRFALLRSDYLSYRRRHRARDGHVRQVLVFFGGTDPHCLTQLAITALSRPEFRHIEVDAVVGPNYPDRDALEEVAAARPFTRIHGPRPHLADLMWATDLAIGAGGTTTWERMCLGLPSLVISTAENQEASCRTLAEAGLIFYLGRHEQVTEQLFTDAFNAAVRDREALMRSSSLGEALVDGWGAHRVVECMMPTPRDQLRLRRAAAEDVLLYFQWANEPEVRRHAIHTDAIPIDAHRRWFAAKLASKDSHLFVMLAGELPVGQIRFDLQNGEAVIDYSIDVAFRGRGWAKVLVRLGMRELSSYGHTAFRADVKVQNAPSIAVFRSLGFSEARRSGELLTFVFNNENPRSYARHD